MEALYRNVRLPESVRGKGGWRSYAQALVRARCRIEGTGNDTKMGIEKPYTTITTPVVGHFNV
jgi:hypothetical protein